jgi:regulator of RNase E activity RraA
MNTSGLLGAHELPEPVYAALKTVSTATLTSEMLQRGFRNTFLGGLNPTRPDLRMVGFAYTLRYAPSREDVGFEVDYDNRTNVQRIAVEAITRNDVLVIDARGSTNAASFGQILATRIAQRGAAGLVTDGCIRDSPGFSGLAMPSYSRGPHGTTSSVAHFPVDMNVPIGCAGVLVMPRDVVVGDAEGVVVIPSAIVAEVATSAMERTRREEYSISRIGAGEPITDLYPLGPSELQRYSESQAGPGGSSGR